MSTRSLKESNTYKKYRKSFAGKKNCIFCEIDAESGELIRETSHFKVIKNKFPYSLWDDQVVDSHLMIVPKKHTDTLSDLSAKEAKEYVVLMSSYEKNGYNILARAPQSTQKSVIHQHTHLIKPGRKSIKFLLYLQKPYFRIFR
jgi:diadenosine tetraphosphate (Ap4A) HIT family hydrolase